MNGKRRKQSDDNINTLFTMLPPAVVFHPPHPTRSLPIQQSLPPQQPQPHNLSLALFTFLSRDLNPTLTTLFFGINLFVYLSICLSTLAKQVKQSNQASKLIQTQLYFRRFWRPCQEGCTWVGELPRFFFFDCLLFCYTRQRECVSEWVSKEGKKGGRAEGRK